MRKQSKDQLSNWIVCINGPMCTGKSTLAERISKDLLKLGISFECIFVGTILRRISNESNNSLGKRINFFLNNNISIPTSIVNYLLQEELNKLNTKCKRVLILEGIPRNDYQIESFPFLHKDRTLLINLKNLPLAEILRRIRGRKICSLCKSLYIDNKCVKCDNKDYIYRSIDIRRLNREYNANQSVRFQLYLSKRLSMNRALVIDTLPLTQFKVKSICLKWLLNFIL